jgi:hypothetical protein
MITLRSGEVPVETPLKRAASSSWWPRLESLSRYPTIGRSEASDARTPNDGMIQNLNLDFNAICLQTIMESIQRMTPEVSPLVALTQQGAEVANVIIAQRSVGNPLGEPSVGNWSNDQGKRARSEAASLTSDNRRLANNDARRRITQNRCLWESGCDCEHLRNIIDDRRHLRARSSTPPWCSPARDATPSERGDFCALAPSLRPVVCLDKFKVRHINKYDGSINLEEFIQVYHTVTKAAGGDNWVKANYLSTTLSSMARSWLINLPEGSIYTWDQLCAMFIRNIQGMYKRPSTVETLKTIRQKHDESLRDYVKHFCNTRNAIPYIKDFKIINTFCDGVSDIKTVGEIAMKKPKTVADLLTVANTCIEASEVRPRLLESCGRGCHTPVLENWTEASIRVSRMFKSHVRPTIWWIDTISR